MNIDAIIMTPIFIRVRASDSVPSFAKGSSAGSCVIQSMPALTAGGKSDAEIATPTNELVWLSNKPTATPRPLKKAIGIPQKKVVMVPLLIISSVGQSASAMGSVFMHPAVITPIIMHAVKLNTSVKKAIRTIL